jgi:NADH dehydrogenase
VHVTVKSASRDWPLAVRRVVVVGAGFAGITLVRALKRAPVEVLLLDRNNFHLFTPLLYQVASALLDPGEIARPVRALTRPLRNVEFRLASVTGVDLAARTVKTDQGDVTYDFLVLAPGSETNYFGNQELAAGSIGLKELGEGLALRNHVLELFEAARWESDAEVRRRLLTFVVVGGGPTGVQYAGALAELIKLVLSRDFRGLDRIRIVLVEGAPHLLSAFEPGLRASAARELEKRGVEVWTGALVRSIEDGEVRLADGRMIAAATVVWTAGVRASPLGAALGVETKRSGRVPVAPSLQLPGHPEVFVIGDLAYLEQDGQELPMLIPVAMQQAKHVGRVIRELAAGRSARAFRYDDPGIMATIGRNAGVAQIGRIRLSGFLGWLTWLFVHLVNVVSFRSKLIVLLNWAWEYLLYDRPVRLILRAADPRTARPEPAHALPSPGAAPAAPEPPPAHRTGAGRRGRRREPGK